MEPEVQYQEELAEIKRRLNWTNFHRWKSVIKDLGAYYNTYGYANLGVRCWPRYYSMRSYMYKSRGILDFCGAYRAFNALPNGVYTNDVVILGADSILTGVFNHLISDHMKYLPAYNVYLKMLGFRLIYPDVLCDFVVKDTRLYRRLVSHRIEMVDYKEECYYGDPIRILLEARYSDKPIRKMPVELIRMIDGYLL